MVWVKVDIMFVSWQMIEHIFFQIINHEILVAMVTKTRLIFHGYVAALYVYRHRYRLSKNIETDNFILSHNCIH